MKGPTQTPSAIMTVVEANLWNVVRALEAIENMAIDIAMASGGEVNAKAEGISGIAGLAVAHIRQQQVALGGQK